MNKLQLCQQDGYISKKVILSKKRKSKSNALYTIHLRKGQSQAYEQDIVQRWNNSRNKVINIKFCFGNYFGGERELTSGKALSRLSKSMHSFVYVMCFKKEKRVKQNKNHVLPSPQTL